MDPSRKMEGGEKGIYEMTKKPVRLWERREKENRVHILLHREHKESNFDIALLHEKQEAFD